MRKIACFLVFLKFVKKYDKNVCFLLKNRVYSVLSKYYEQIIINYETENFLHRTMYDGLCKLDVCTDKCPRGQRRRGA